MKSSVLLMIFILLLTSSLSAQNEEKAKQSGWINDIGLNFSLPLGRFGESHILGIGVQYSWGLHHYGKMNATPIKQLGFTANTGVDYYFGKKETIGTIPNTTTYKNQGYTFVHLYGGLVYHLNLLGDISLTAGPAMGFVGGHTNFNLGANLSTSFFTNPRKNIWITPNVTLMKQKRSDALYALAVRISYAF